MIWILPAGEEAQCPSELERPFCLPAHKDHSSALSGTDVVPALPVPAVLGRSLGGGEVAGQEGFLQGRGPARALPNSHTPRARPAFQGGESPSSRDTWLAGVKGMNRGPQRLPTPDTSPESPALADGVSSRRHGLQSACSGTWAFSVGNLEARG